MQMSISIFQDEKIDEAEMKRYSFYQFLMKTTSLNYLIDYLSLILSSLLITRSRDQTTIPCTYISLRCIYTLETSYLSLFRKKTRVFSIDFKWPVPGGLSSCSSETLLRYHEFLSK